MQDERFRIHTEIGDTARGDDRTHQDGQQRESSKPGKQNDESDRYTVSTGYGETFDERGWKGKIYGATTNDRSICMTTIALLFAPYSKITSPSAGP
jgi:hypothetical protein